MKIEFEVPDTLIELQEDYALLGEKAWPSDLKEFAKEAFVIEAYRRGIFGQSLVAEALGLEDFSAAGWWLHARDVPPNFGAE